MLIVILKAMYRLSHDICPDKHFQIHYEKPLFWNDGGHVQEGSTLTV